MNDSNNSICNLHDGEIGLELTLHLRLKKEFYYKILKEKTNEYVGTICLLLKDNKENEYLGNIGYEVFDKYKGNNYAYKASRLVAKLAYDNGISNLIITANPSNIPSIKTIEKLGARFIDIREVPKNHVLYKQGDRFLAIYHWNIEERGEEYDRYKVNKRK